MDEFQALQKNKTQTLTHLPPNRTAIGCRWIFRVKENVDGSIQCYKARLVAKGFNQREGYDYSETFSPVVKPITIRIILNIALSHGWTINQLDVHNAFLHGTLDEEVYMHQPPGFKHANKSLVCKLDKVIYGLKQAPRAWFKKLASILTKFGFIPSNCDNSLFICNAANHIVFILVYVDDILVTGSSPSIVSSIISALSQHISLRDLGKVNYFLGVEVQRTNNGSLHLTQTKYIKDLLTRTKMHAAKGVNSPMIPGQKL